MKWIDVKQEMPPLGSDVLVWLPEARTHVRIVRYSKESENHLMFVRPDRQWWNDGHQITHWLIPASPESVTK